MRELHRFVFAVALASCSEERESAAPRSEVSVAPVAEEVAPPAEPPARVDAPEPHVRPAEPSHTVTGAAASEEIARAIEPVEGAAGPVATVERNATIYVLYQYYGTSVARERILATADGEFRLEAIEEALDACADEGDYAIYGCAVAAAPDPYLAAAALAGDDVHGWGVAVLERDGTRYRARAKRMLFALSRDDGAIAERADLRVRDPDADGENELIVTLPIATVRDDNSMNGTDEGIVAYVLEADTLRTQFRVTSEWYSSMVDAGGTIRTCRAGWRFTDLDEDGHDDITVRARCTSTIVDEYEAEESSTFSSTPHDCLWKAEIDAWTCPPSESWLFIEGALAADTPEALVASLPNLGQNVEAIVESARRELEAEDDEDGEAESNDAASSEPACEHVVADPAPPLHIRASPSSRSAISGELPNASRVRLLERRGRWARIEAPVPGWIWTEHLTRDCD